MDDARLAVLRDEVIARLGPHAALLHDPEPMDAWILEWLRAYQARPQ